MNRKQTSDKVIDILLAEASPPIRWRVERELLGRDKPKTVRRGARLRRARLLTKGHKGHAWRPVYSPDGRVIVYGIQREIDFYADRVRLVAYDRSARTSTVLTESWQLSASNWTFGEDPRTLYLIAEVDARTAVFTLDIKAALKRPDRHPPHSP